MRSDMAKVIVERPRSRFNWRDRPGRRERDLESLPYREGIRKRGRVINFNDHLRPFRRFLASQIGRPWNEVYRNICRFADPRSKMGYHLREHVEFELEDNTKIVNGRLYHLGWDYDNDCAAWIVPSYSRFYVDADGILRHHQPEAKKRTRRRRKSQPLVRKPESDDFDATLKAHSRRMRIEEATRLSEERQAEMDAFRRSLIEIYR